MVQIGCIGSTADEDRGCVGIYRFDSAFIDICDVGRWNTGMIQY